MCSLHPGTRSRDRLWLEPFFLVEWQLLCRSFLDFKSCSIVSFSLFSSFIKKSPDLSYCPFLVNPQSFHNPSLPLLRPQNYSTSLPLPLPPTSPPQNQEIYTCQHPRSFPAPLNFRYGIRGAGLSQICKEYIISLTLTHCAYAGNWHLLAARSGQGRRATVARNWMLEIRELRWWCDYGELFCVVLHIL